MESPFLFGLCVSCEVLESTHRIAVHPDPPIKSIEVPPLVDRGQHPSFAFVPKPFRKLHVLLTTFAL
jgi:hypothetical protein